MDLVDIDKVLDDLEFDENEISKTQQNFENKINSSLIKSECLENKTSNNIENVGISSTSLNLKIENETKSEENSNKKKLLPNSLPTTSLSSSSSSSSASSATTTTTPARDFIQSTINENSHLNSTTNNKLENLNINRDFSLPAKINSIDAVATVAQQTIATTTSAVAATSEPLTTINFSWNATNVTTTTTTDVYNNSNSFDPSSIGSTANERSNKNNGSSNRIIAVSQVFNSLDEYRRDVESLRVDMNKITSCENHINEYETLNKNTDIINKVEIQDSSCLSQNFSKTSKNDCELTNDTISKSTSDIKIKSNISDLQQDTTTKFTNEYILNKMMEDDDSVDVLTSSSSITTSSPSSFSSGPSPRSPSSADCIGDDDVNELGEYEGDDISSIQSNNIIDDKTEQILQKKYIKENKTIPVNVTNEIKSQNISKIGDDDENLEDSNGQNSIDLVGLSSISSSLYIENSISSIQPELPIEQNKNTNKYINLSNIKINDESHNDELSSICEIKKINKSEEISTDDDISTPTRSEIFKNCDINDTNKDNECNENIKTPNNINDDKNCLAEKNSTEIIHSIQKSDEKQKDEFNKENNLSPKKNYNLPITFGSTMDEISDTELDSMLQDIDNELQNSGISKEKLISKCESFLETQKIDDILYKDEISNKLKNLTNLESNIFSNNVSTSEKDSVIEDSLEKSKIFQINSFSSFKEELSNPSMQDCEINDDIKMSNKISDDDINLQNADSFSQASTIEFADLQTQNDLGIVNYNEINSNGAGIINDNKIDKINYGNDNNNIKREQECDISELQQNIKNNDNQTSLIENYIQSEVEINENIIKTKEQSISRRPRVLNLPIINSTAIGLSKNASILDTDSRTIDTLNIDGTAGQTPPASALTNVNTNLSNICQDTSPIIISLSISNQLQQKQQQQSGNDDNLSNIIETSREILPHTVDNNTNGESDKFTTGTTISKSIKNQNNQLGKVPPFWIPDSEASYCMQCKVKFSLIKRRHHCRACGHVLCSLCCSQKAKLEFLGNDNEVRVCVKCHLIINNMENNIDNSDNQSNESISELGAVGGAIISGNNINNTMTSSNNITTGIRHNSSNILTRSPNPNNPMEYCSTIPPHEQVKKNQSNNKPISVMVPVGVLKREGTLSKNRKDKNVIFSDGIRPGCDLADLDNCWLDKGGVNNNLQNNSTKKNADKEYIPPANPRILRKVLPQCDENNSYIPKEVNGLPPIYEKVAKTNEYDYKEVINNNVLIERLQKECLKFAVQRNFYVYVKIVKLTCCVNKTVINFTTNGMHHVGQDEIILLLEYDNSNIIPKDIFIHLNEIYRDADKGHPITELGYSISKQQNFLNNVGSGSSSSNIGGTSLKTSTNGGFLYIRSTFQCLQEIQLPDPPFLIGVLIHRWEIPWAKIFPLRLMLRLGAQYRYYPSPHLSIRGRNSVYAEIAQTIINFLADFRNYSYTIPIIKGMFIHMEDRKTSVLIPKNRHDQIVKAINNSSDHILALGGNFSKNADGHLVCIQNLESDCPDSHTYSTQAINIQGQPRRVTGASFIVLNGALKTNSGLSGKCSIIEDGLMVHILSQKMQSIRKNLINMKDIDIRCGPIDADETQTEMVSMQWIDDDTEFNIGVTSPIDDKKLDGISSIRVHSGLNYSNSNFIIRWTEVFLIQSKEETIPGKISIDISKISEQIARSTSTALVPLLDLLVASGCVKIALRVTLHQDNVCYEAGSKNFKLAPLYMNALDNELIPILHKQATMYEINNPIILELIFHILYK